MCGTVTRHDGTVRRFGFVPNIDEHPRRRIHETLVAQGMAANQLVTFLSDGADDLAKVDNPTGRTRQPRRCVITTALRTQQPYGQPTDALNATDPQDPFGLDVLEGPLSRSRLCRVACERRRLEGLWFV